MILYLYFVGLGVPMESQIYFYGVYYVNEYVNTLCFCDAICCSLRARATLLHFGLIPYDIGTMAFVRVQFHATCSRYQYLNWNWNLHIKITLISARAPWVNVHGKLASPFTKCIMTPFVEYLCNDYDWHATIQWRQMSVTATQINHNWTLCSTVILG